MRREKGGKKRRKGAGAKSAVRSERAASGKQRDPSPRHRKLVPELRMTKGGRVSRGRAGELLEGLVELQARLRGPDGCPWDREQTHDSLRTYLIEETYELLEALDSGDDAKIAGELGDLLLQIVFHAQLAREAGRFDVAHVIERIHTKMVRRHPHVFGDAEARTAAQVLKNWEQLKKEERKAEGGERGDGAAASVLDGVPRTLPALLEAYQLTRRAANVGFDWENIDGVLEKMEEEIGELRASLARESSAGRRAGIRESGGLPPHSKVEEEIGDLLFVAVNVARFLGADPEIALKKANRKFAKRFREMERRAAQEGKRLTEMKIEEMEELWREVKKVVNG